MNSYHQITDQIAENLGLSKCTKKDEYFTNLENNEHGFQTLFIKSYDRFIQIHSDLFSIFITLEDQKASWDVKLPEQKTLFWGEEVKGQIKILAGLLKQVITNEEDYLQALEDVETKLKESSMAAMPPAKVELYNQRGGTYFIPLVTPGELWQENREEIQKAASACWYLLAQPTLEIKTKVIYGKYNGESNGQDVFVRITVESKNDKSEIYVYGEVGLHRTKDGTWGTRTYSELPDSWGVLITDHNTNSPTVFSGYQIARTLQRLVLNSAEQFGKDRLFSIVGKDKQPEEPGEFRRPRWLKDEVIAKDCVCINQNLKSFAEGEDLEFEKQVAISFNSQANEDFQPKQISLFNFVEKAYENGCKYIRISTKASEYDLYSFPVLAFPLGKFEQFSQWFEKSISAWAIQPDGNYMRATLQDDSTLGWLDIPQSPFFERKNSWETRSTVSKESIAQSGGKSQNYKISTHW